MTELRPPLAPPGAVPPADPGRLVRPYTLTGGRTRPSADLALEAQVVARPAPPDALVGLSPAHRSLWDRCAKPLSIAELSAHEALPLGVTRVLVADLVTNGFVELPSTTPHTGDGAVNDVNVLERVLHGLRSL